MATGKKKKPTQTTVTLANGDAAKRAKKNASLDCVIEARCVRTSQMFLRFADGLEGTWSFRQLGLDISNMKLTSIKASASGKSINVKSRWGDDVQLDSSALRTLIDPDYAAASAKRLDALASKIGL